MLHFRKNMKEKKNIFKIFQKKLGPELKLNVSRNFSGVKETTCRVLESSTSHGIPNILRAERFSIKILWTLFTFVATALCAVLIIQSILNYLEFGVTTTIRIKNEISSTFPAITLCSLSLSLSDTQTSRKIINSTEQYFATVIKDEKRTEYSWNEFIYVCFFDSMPCVGASFVKYSHPSGSLCFTFNSGFDDKGKQIKPLKSVKTGRIKGLLMHLNTWLFKQMFTGAYVYIHDQKTSPLSVEPLDIVPGEETTISVYKTISYQQPRPFSECEYENGKVLLVESDLVKAFRTISYQYSQNLCLELCFHKIMLEKCNCYSNLFSMFTIGKPCQVIQDTMCCWKEFHKFSNSNSIAGNCRERCPLECKTIVYSKTISRKKYLDNNEKISVAIRFDGLGYTEIKESPIMNIVDLLSNIGGIGGLFLGISLLSFVEIFEIFMEIYYLFCQKEQN